ncbi:hypothetical protein AVDCRST_MAG81-1631 [uncultured Synechococcales cyanobacterium]|uniref:Uncharacterized protein n=1 Tax=uncultured Synechococcales cyanobacterium TaxID=1936017 RepID=A0A6J4V640_9CYAN|nr:hypothetical protein AVDCRST_MAG81-1631 [uncultured Synechococcales cyanobacterium]
MLTPSGARRVIQLRAGKTNFCAEAVSSGDWYVSLDKELTPLVIVSIYQVALDKAVEMYFLPQMKLPSSALMLLSSSQSTQKCKLAEESLRHRSLIATYVAL